MRSGSTRWPARAALAAVLAAGTQAAAEDGAFGRLEPEFFEFYGNAELELTLFPQGARFPGQRDQDASFAVEPTLFAEWADGDLTATLTPFVRVDAADHERTHFDLREAKFDYRRGNFTTAVELRSFQFVDAGLDQAGDRQKCQYSQRCGKIDMRHMPRIDPEQNIKEMIGIALVGIQVQTALQQGHPPENSDEQQQSCRKNKGVWPAHSPSFSIFWPQ